MAETSKKKPRKSKIVLRECIDLEDDNDSSKQMEESVRSIQEPTILNTLLPKLKNSIDNESYNPTPTPVQFSIQVDVETFIDDNYVQEGEIIDEIDDDAILVSSLPTKEVIISSDAIRQEVEKLSTLTTYSDRRLGIEVRNFWGKNLSVLHVPDKHDKMIQDVMTAWKYWNVQSKIRSTIFAYKCYICSIGWWFLGPFREHIKIHDDVTIHLNTHHHECSIVAARGEWYENMCKCKIEGNCPKCLKSYEQHSVQKRDKMFYYCDACSVKFATCLTLFEHEGVCIRYEKLIYKHVIPTESQWRCDICDIVCLTQQRYDEHYSLAHMVRSDVPIMVPTLRNCILCSLPYYTYSIHCCPQRAENIKCKYCCRKFQHRVLAEIHMQNTKKDYSCKICKRYLKSQCMEMEHLLKHNKNYVLVYKCCECLDNVLLANENLMRKHKMKWHSKRVDMRRSYYCPMIIPISCMTDTSSEDVNVEDMVIDKQNMNKALVIDKKTVTSQPIAETQDNDTKEGILPANLTENIANQSKAKKKVTVNIVYADVSSKTYADVRSKTPRTYSKLNSNKSTKTDQIKEMNDIKASTSSNNEVETAIEGLKDADDVKIKEENVNDEFVDVDDDIKETQNSVDALLNHVNIKDDIVIEEPIWDHIVIEDSLDGITDNDESQKTSLKQETEVKNQSIEVNNIRSEHKGIDIKMEVDIKQEVEDYEEFNEKTDEDLEKEQNACLQELSKVFRASKDAGTLKLTDISLAEEINIKEEPIEDDYEDDIIMLYNTKPSNFDITVTAEDIKEENLEDETYESSKDLSSETDYTKFEPEVKIKRGPYEKVLTDSGEVIVNQGKKLYSCKKCNFVAKYKEFCKHKETVCLRRKNNRKQKGDDKIKHYGYTWPDVDCTKCNTPFKSIRTYLLHFTKHNLKQGSCPKCPKKCKFGNLNRLVYHLIAHIKNSFIKLQLLSTSSCLSSKKSGIYQCKDCQEQVKYMDFFIHWEKHLDLEKRNEKKKLVELEDKPGLSSLIVFEEEGDVKDKAPRHHQQLSEENRKILLDQLSKYGADSTKRCELCQRLFSRRNDVKRHVIEHLLRDAQCREPALVCQLCQHKANKIDAYKIHMRNHAALPVFKCEICNKWFSDSSNFAKHKKVHNLHVLSICDLCKKKFHSRFGLIKHMEMHQTTQPINCKECDRIFYSESAFKKHYKIKHDKTRATRLCRICMTRFYNMRTMWNHMWEVHKERSIKADCPICNKQFRKLQDVRKHIKEDHKKSSHRLNATQQTKNAKHFIVEHFDEIMDKASQVNRGISVVKRDKETLVVYDDN